MADPIEMNRREYDRQLNAIDKKIDELSAGFQKMQETLREIAVQSYQIQTLQAMQTEMRGDINEITNKIEHIAKWQAGCPKASVNALWVALLSFATILIGTFVGHVIQNGAK